MKLHLLLSIAFASHISLFNDRSCQFWSANPGNIQGRSVCYINELQGVYKVTPLAAAHAVMCVVLVACWLRNYPCIV